jgi:hypothetical protein
MALAIVIAAMLLLIVPQVVLLCWLGQRRDGVTWKRKEFWTSGPPAGPSTQRVTPVGDDLVLRNEGRSSSRHYRRSTKERDPK